MCFFTSTTLQIPISLALYPEGKTFTRSFSLFLFAYFTYSFLFQWDTEQCLFPHGEVHLHIPSNLKIEERVENAERSHESCPLLCVKPIPRLGGKILIVYNRVFLPWSKNDFENERIILSRILPGVGLHKLLLLLILQCKSSLVWFPCCLLLFVIASVLQAVHILIEVLCFQRRGSRVVVVSDTDEQVCLVDLKQKGESSVVATH